MKKATITPMKIKSFMAALSGCRRLPGNQKGRDGR
jgi:hypothetical protein